jgi:Mrp family chromosome partitioning ATPase
MQPYRFNLLAPILRKSSRGHGNDLRGPMVIGTLQQMLREVDWGELDIMIVDLPRAPAMRS